MSGIVQKNNNLHDLSPRNHSADSAVQSNNAIFRSCSKCGALYRSHKYSKSCQCRRCANIEAVETRRHREGVVKICPYCGEEFIAINGAKKCNKKKCRKAYHNECLDAYHRKHPDFRKICERCGKEFIASSCKQRYCSQSCGSRGNPKLKALGEKKHKQRIEECIYHIGMCNTKGELKRRFPSDYNFCCKYRISEYVQLANEPNVTIKYSDEEVLRVASLYKNKGKGAFQKEERNLYAVAKRRGLLGKIEFRPQQHLFGNINFVYRYFFQEQKAVYVGRTIKPQQRDYEHRRDRGKDSSSVFKFANLCASKIPQMEILASGLSGEESQIMEDKYVRQYKEHGFVILNKGATGLGTGAMGMKRQHSEETFMNIAHMYDSYSLFKQEHPRLFHAGERYGWLKKCAWLQHDVRLKNTITKEYCLEVARQYTFRSELAEADPTVYEFIRRNCLWKFCPTIRKNIGSDYPMPSC